MFQQARFAVQANEVVHWKSSILYLTEKDSCL